jgi:CRP-like cAMP-binding protein
MVDVSDLRDLAVFHSLNDKQLHELAAISQSRTCGKRDVVYERGQRAEYLWVVKKGKVTLRRFDPGDVVGLAFETRGMGQLFGAACFMEDQEYTLTAICLEDSELVAIDAAKLKDLCRSDPELGYLLMFNIAKIYFERYRIAKAQLFEMLKAARITTAVIG